MNIEKSVAEYVIYFSAEYIQSQHRGHKLEKQWCQTYIDHYEALKTKYKDCFGEKKTSAKLDEHKVLACFLIAIQMTDYPVHTETNKFRKELLAMHIFERTMQMFFQDLYKQTNELKYQKAYKEELKYPEKINGDDDYRRQFVKSLFYSYDKGNKDIFNLSNIMFLLEQFNIKHWEV